MGAVDPRKAAVDAWWMGLERENRQPTPRESFRVRQERSAERSRLAAEWAARWMPECVTPAGSACAYAVEAVLWVRRERDDLRGDALVAAARNYRAWLMRNVPTGDVVLPGDDSDERVAA